MLTEKQIKGCRFEIWLELLPRKTGDLNVRRNVIVRNPAKGISRRREGWNSGRQIDLTFSYVENGEIYTAIVEAKYLDKGLVNYDLREKAKVRKDSVFSPIDNIVDDLYEKQLYAGAANSFLITNMHFHADVKKQASFRRVKVLEREQLYALWNDAVKLNIAADYSPWRKIPFGSEIECFIRAINLQDFDLRSDLVKNYN